MTRPGGLSASGLFCIRLRSVPREGKVPLQFVPERERKRPGTYDEVARWGFKDPKGVSRALAVACEAQDMDIKAITDEAMLSWDQIREMQRDPLVTFGVHTASHLGLTKLPEEQAIAEVAVAQERLRADSGFAHTTYCVPVRLVWRSGNPYR